MSQNFENKKLLVADIKDKITRAKSVIFVNYGGTTVAEDTELRNKMRSAGCEYHVYKNRLVKLALDECGITCLDGKLGGTLAVAFSFNGETEAANVLNKVSKDGKLAMQFGLVNGQFVDASALKVLANLPSKEVLVAQLLGLLQAPATRLCRVLNAPVQGLAVALNAIAQK